MKTERKSAINCANRLMSEQCLHQYQYGQREEAGRDGQHFKEAGFRHYRNSLTSFQIHWTANKRVVLVGVQVLQP